MKVKGLITVKVVRAQILATFYNVCQCLLYMTSHAQNCNRRKM